MPGMGPILGAEFIAITAGDLAAFGTAGAAGHLRRVSPSARRFRQAQRGAPPAPPLPPPVAARLLHGRLLEPQNRRPITRVLCEQRSERQRHTRAMIALARRLVDVLWALLRDNRTWQPQPPTPRPLPPLDTIIEIHQGSTPPVESVMGVSSKFSGRMVRGGWCQDPQSVGQREPVQCHDDVTTGQEVRPTTPNRGGHTWNFSLVGAAHRLSQTLAAIPADSLTLPYKRQAADSCRRRDGAVAQNVRAGLLHLARRGAPPCLSWGNKEGHALPHQVFNWYSTKLFWLLRSRLRVALALHPSSAHALFFRQSAISPALVAWTYAYHLRARKPSPICGRCLVGESARRRGSAWCRLGQIASSAHLSGPR